MLVVYTLVCDKVQVISIDVSTEDPPTCYSSYLVCEKLQERVDLFQTVDELRECIKYIRNEDFFSVVNHAKQLKQSGRIKIWSCKTSSIGHVFIRYRCRSTETPLSFLTANTDCIHTVCSSRNRANWKVGMSHASDVFIEV